MHRPWPNTRVQRTRVARCARPGSPLTRHPLGGLRIAIVVALTLLLCGRTARACGCEYVPSDLPPSIDMFRNDSNVLVFVGVIESLESHVPASAMESVARTGVSLTPDLELALQVNFGTTATFWVDEYWSGVRIGKRVQVHTGGGCGIAWRVGDCYLVGAAWEEDEDGGWDTNACGLTTEFHKATSSMERLYLLEGPGIKPGE